MWILLNNSFISVVENRKNSNELIIRSRAEKDLLHLFPEEKIIKNFTADYRYRCVVNREILYKKLKSLVENINYDNFKNSIDPRDKKRHNIYYDCWKKLRQLQE